MGCWLLATDILQLLLSVIPAKAGIQSDSPPSVNVGWIPAFAGMTAIQRLTTSN